VFVACEEGVLAAGQGRVADLERLGVVEVILQLLGTSALVKGYGSAFAHHTPLLLPLQEPRNTLPSIPQAIRYSPAMSHNISPEDLLKLILQWCKDHGDPADILLQ
jgi:hypothetical protein